MNKVDTVTKQRVKPSMFTIMNGNHTSLPITQTLIIMEHYEWLCANKSEQLKKWRKPNMD